MTIVDLLTQYLEQHGGEAATLTDGDQVLRVVAGRPGSICFTLQREVAPETRVVVAEGFSLADHLDYVQLHPPLTQAEIERRITELIGSARPSQLRQPRATPKRTLGTVHAAEIAAGG